MDYGRPKVSSSAAPVIPDEYYAMGARYADRRGRAGAMASLATPAIMANFNRNTSSSVEVLYPGTAKLSGGLLTSLIRSPDLDSNYVQRFQHIAIIAQLADAILSVAHATGKCIVPVDFDSSDNDNESQEENCSCEICSKEKRKKNNGVAVGSDGDTQGSLKGNGKEKEKEREIEDNNNNNNPVNGEERDGLHADKASTHLGHTNSGCTGHGIFRPSPSSSTSNKPSAVHH